MPIEIVTQYLEANMLYILRQIIEINGVVDHNLPGGVQLFQRLCHYELGWFDQLWKYSDPWMMIDITIIRANQKDIASNTVSIISMITHKWFC